MRISKNPIMAEEDPFEDMTFDEESPDMEEDEDTIEDNIEEMADTLDQINDSLDEFEEDDVDIDIENNINDHYIAECDKCHGIFISAVVETDQDIEKISGICPLCDQETDQYLKWVIKEL